MREAAIRGLLDEYAALRRQSQRELDERTQNAAAKDPQLGALIEKRARLFTDMIRETVQMPGQAPALLERTRALKDSLDGEINSRLQALGLPGDTLELRCRCPICRDTGYVGSPVRSFCECLSNRLFVRMCELSGLSLDQAACFAAFDETIFPDEGESEISQRRYMAIMQAYCRKFADQFPETEARNLVFLGASGLGKTFLAECIAHRVLERGHSALKVTAYQMVEAMRIHHRDFVGEDDSRFEMMMQCDLLLLDDLGSEPLMKNVTVTYLYNLINERAAARRHTIVATNLSPSEMQARYTERVTSRLFDTRISKVFQLKGRDVRMDRARQRG